MKTGGRVIFPLAHILCKPVIPKVCSADIGTWKKKAHLNNSYYGCNIAIKYSFNKYWGSVKHETFS